MSALPRPEFDEDIDGDAAMLSLDTANLRLAKRFVTMLFDDPSIAGDIPAEAYVIFLPEDDPDLARSHAAAGERMRAAGQIVHFVRM